MNEFINENKEAMISDLIDFVNIPSVVSEREGIDIPFGMAVLDSLKFIMNKAKSFGFEVKNYENYVAEISIGEGEHNIGVLCHSDVVPEGQGWQTPAFEGVVRDGKIFGRGTLDDKGPLISCLYAMKNIMDHDLLPKNNKITMIVGTDEEENWESIRYYLKNAVSLPDVSIVPDGNFPVIFCEKGLINFELKYEKSKYETDGENDIIEFFGGEKTNVVPNTAYCTIKLSETIDVAQIEKNILDAASKKAINVKIEKHENGMLRLITEGKGAHAMTPEKGINAISQLMVLFNSLQSYNIKQNKLIDVYNRYIGMDCNGEHFGCNVEDEPSGKLTLNVGTIRSSDDDTTLGINLRYPVTFDFDEIYGRLRKTAEISGFSIEFKNDIKPIYFDKNSDLIKELMEVYRNATDDENAGPIAIGGATYARAIPNAVAFGPVFPWREELAHEANEYLEVEDFLKITEIYINALVALTKR